MRRQTPIAHLLYNYLFPRPTPNDPPSFAAHLARNLVPEVRIEVSTFYGDLNSVEARYPGLNYCYPPHRMRLGRFKHHRRLFDAFDNLGLTYNEIQDFCCWEGTKWARERYEKDEGIYVLDTTGDDIGPFIDRRNVVSLPDEQRRKITRQTQISVIMEEAMDGPVLSNTNNHSLPGLPRHPHHHHNHTPDAEMSDVDSLASEDSSSDQHDLASDNSDDTTLALPHQFLAQTALPRQPNNPSTSPPTIIPPHILTAWEQGHQLPPELEQFLKDHASEGGYAEGRRLVPAGFDLRPLMSPSSAATATATATAATGAAAAAALTAGRRAGTGTGSTRAAAA